MNVLLQKILFKKQSSKPITLLVCVVGIYIGILFWYLVMRIHLLNNLGITAAEFASFICLPFIIIMIMYKSVDSVFYNKHIETILTMPIQVIRLLSVYLLEVLKLPAALVFVLYLTSFISGNFHAATLKLCFISLNCSYTFTLFIFIICLLVLRICSAQFIGYIFTLLQYCGFIVTLLLSKDFVPYLLLYKPSMIITHMRKILTHPWFIVISLGINVIISLVTWKLFSDIFVYHISKIINFQFIRRIPLKRSIFKMKYPYQYLEKKRYLQNKELIFYACLKNILSIIVIYKLFISRFKIPEVELKMLILLLLSSTSIYAATSYSSDPDSYRISHFLPANPYKIYKSKVLSSFLLNEFIILLYVIATYLQTPTLQALLFLIYGSFTNYICSAFGVFTDFMMPHLTENKSELFHGNINKLFTVVFALLKLVLEIYIIKLLLPPDYLLLLSILMDALIIILFHIASQILWRKYYD